LSDRTYLDSLPRYVGTSASPQPAYGGHHGRHRWPRRRCPSAWPPITATYTAAGRDRSSTDLARNLAQAPVLRNPANPKRAIGAADNKSGRSRVRPLAVAVPAVGGLAHTRKASPSSSRHPMRTRTLRIGPLCQRCLSDVDAVRDAARVVAQVARPQTRSRGRADWAIAVRGRGMTSGGSTANQSCHRRRWLTTKALDAWPHAPGGGPKATRHRPTCAPYGCMQPAVATTTSTANRPRTWPQVMTEPLCTDRR
jgi:hypothetical protein